VPTVPSGRCIPPGAVADSVAARGRAASSGNGRGFEVLLCGARGCDGAVVAAVFGGWDHHLQRACHAQSFDPNDVQILKVGEMPVGVLDVQDLPRPSSHRYAPRPYESFTLMAGLVRGAARRRKWPRRRGSGKRARASEVGRGSAEPPVCRPGVRRPPERTARDPGDEIVPIGGDPRFSLRRGLS
jgi:hypothetical protein